MKRQKLRVGIVGCGEITQTVHIPILLEMKEFEITALCDLSQKVRSTLAERYRIDSVFEDYRDLVEQTDVDVVLVANRDHAPVALAAMNAGKHVLVEKPMAFTLEEADQMINAASENKVKLMVGYMKRYDPAFQYALDQIKAIEKPQLIRVHDFAGDFSINHEIYDQVYGNDIDPALREVALRDEAEKMLAALGDSHCSYLEAYSNLLYLLIHDLILLNSIYGLPDEVLFTEVYNNNSIISVLKYGEHTRCILEGGMITSRRDWDEQFCVYGDNKRVEIQFPFPYVKNVPTIVSINEQDGKENIEKRVTVSYDEAFKREWRHLYECVLTDREPITSGANSRKEMEIILEIIKAARPIYA